MKKLLLFLCLAMAQGLFAVNVTFQVNMAQQTVSTNGVFVAGSFQGWNATASPMQDADGDLVYTFTADIAAGTNIEYKFINGSTWEQVPAACGVGGFSNRSLNVPNSDQVLSPVCFNACSNCAVVNMVPVTFQVNMNGQTVGANGVHIAGSFQGWNPSSTALTDSNADGVYEVTVNIAEGETVNYKFINGNAWSGSETVPSACGVGDGFGGFNRSYVVSNTNPSVVCFGQCENCQTSGCMDNTACNYNANATTDDGSCLIIGTTCDDGDNSTANDLVQNDCNCSGTPALPIMVIFQVDMNNETIDPNGVHIAGSFQGWNASATPMSDSNADGIYEATVNLVEGEVVNYKFINGNAWTGSETVPTACGVGDGFGGFNRSYVVSNANPTIVCFGQCENCQTPGCMDNAACNFNASATTDDGSCLIIGTTCDDGDNSTANDLVQNDCTCMGTPAIPTMVIFQVDMTNEMVDATGVFVAGSFNGWDATATQMSEFQPGQYQAVAFVFPGEEVQYKFLNGNDWAGVESVPTTCGMDDGSGNINRSLTVGTTAITTPMVCFSSCEACIPVDMSSVTFTVDMTNENVSPNGVHIAGSFQNWVAGATPMTNSGNGLYTYTTNIPTGTTIQYKFINGNDWSGAEEVAFACAFNDGMGNYNRSHNVVPGNNNIGPVCFTQCEACQPTAVVVVRVDMSDETVSPNGVYFTTQLDNYTPNAHAMSDLGGGIWEGSMAVPANSDLFYRFVNGNTTANFETVPGTCGALDNGELQRFIPVGTSNLVVDAVCFSSCGSCTGINDDVTLTFQLDVSNITVDPNGIHIAGSFQGWNASTTAMTDLGNGIWSYSLTTNPNQTFQYKFINGSDWNGSETVPGDCGVDNGFGGFNREVVLSSNSVTLMPVCFNECATCNGSNFIYVTFKVDLSNEATIDPSGVFVTGSFQGNTLGSSPLNSIGNGVYEGTFPIPTESFIFYRFSNGNQNPEIVPSECGVLNNNGYMERVFQLGATDTTINMVCLNACTPCNVDVTETMNAILPYPNPFQNYLQLQHVKGGTIQILNSIGQVMFSHQNFNLTNIPTESWPSGVYTLKTGSINIKLIKP